MIDKGALFKVLIKADNIEWSSLISRRERLDLAIEPGVSLNVEVPAEWLHIIGST